MCIMVVLQVVRLRKSMRRLSLHPAAAAAEPEPSKISTGPRRKLEQENLQYESRDLKLIFSNFVINGPIYTGRPVGGDPLKLDLLDSRTGKIIKSGAEASAKVEILALDKEFKSYYKGNWSAEEFNSGIVGEKSLIRGDPHVTLKHGSASLSHIQFKHTNVPIRKREFRLGARALIHPYRGKRIMEAVTEPFFVNDRRAMPKREKPLNLDDEVWKLETIGKRGGFHDRLKKENIKTVRDFLTQYYLNRERLFSILGRHMSAKKLEAAVNKAKDKLDLKTHLYHSQQNIRVVFTDVGEVIGVYQQPGQFTSVEKLTEIQKASALELVKEAFPNGENLKVLDDDIDTCKVLWSAGSLQVDAIDTSTGLSFETVDIEQQQMANANFMLTTSRIHNYDSISLINSLPNLTSDISDPPFMLDQYDSLWDF